jgi:hypothetical protein
LRVKPRAGVRELDAILDAALTQPIAQESLASDEGFLRD